MLAVEDNIFHLAAISSGVHVGGPAYASRNPPGEFQPGKSVAVGGITGLGQRCSRFADQHITIYRTPGKILAQKDGCGLDSLIVDQQIGALSQKKVRDVFSEHWQQSRQLLYPFGDDKQRNGSPNSEAGVFFHLLVAKKTDARFRAVCLNLIVTIHPVNPTPAFGEF